MPVASSSITIAAIAAEIGGQSAPHTLSTLAGLSSGTFSGSGNKVAPHTMSEWAGYTHTTTFPTTETHARFGTTTGSWAVRVHTSHLASSAHAAGGVYIFQREISGDTVFQAEVVTEIEAGVGSQVFDSSYFTAGGTDPGSSGSFGSDSNHSSPVSIMTIPGVTGITASLSVAPQSGYSHTTYPVSGQDVHATMAALSGFVGNSWDGESDGPLGGYGAVAALNSSFGVQTRNAYTDWTITISKSGYVTKELATFSSWSRNIATYSGGGGG